jgi:hypothetical protein
MPTLTRPLYRVRSTGQWRTSSPIRGALKLTPEIIQAIAQDYREIVKESREAYERRTTKPT